MATKAEEIYNQTHTLMEQGMSRAEAFTRIAEEESRPKDSIRGAYYGHKKKLDGGTPARSRKRETTPADAVQLATATLRKAIEAIEGEIAAAEERSKEAAAEAKDLKASAAARKAEIEAKITALEA